MFIFRSIRHLQEASATDGKGKFLCVLCVLLFLWPAFPKALCWGTVEGEREGGGSRCWLLWVWGGWAGFVRAAQLLGGEAGGECCRDLLCKAWG